MGLLQFAATLHATTNAATANATQAGKEGAGGATAAPFDPMGAVSAIQDWTAKSSKGGAARLGYGGSDGAQHWAEEEKARSKEKKRKRKAKKAEKKKRKKRKQRKKAKIDQLVNAQGLTEAAAAAMVEDVYASTSDSDSDSYSLADSDSDSS